MRLESLDITNYRVIKRARLQLPDKLIGIIGPNGSGKSTIVEAIAWALYGHQVARSGKDEIKSSWVGVGDICEVSLGFVLRDDRYRVTRRIVGRTDRVEVELWRNDQRETTGSTDSQEYLDKLLGLDWRGFLTSFLARQSELNALSDLAPAKRRDHLAGMLGIERLDRAIIKLKADVRLDQEKSQFMERQLAGQSMLQERLGTAVQVTGDLELQLVKVTGAREEASARAATVMALLSEHEGRREQCSQTEAQLKTVRQEAGMLAERQKQLEHELALLDRAREELEQIEKQLPELVGLRAELERQIQAKQLALLKEDLARQLAKGSHDSRAESEKLGRLREEVGRTETALATIPQDLDDSVRSVVEKLEIARDQFAQKKARKDALTLDQTRISDQLNSIGKLGPDAVCDRCGRPIGEDRDQIVGHFKIELAGTLKQVEMVTAELTELERSGKQLRESQLAFEKQVIERQRLLGQKESLDRMVVETEKRLSELQAAVDNIGGRLAELGGDPFDSAVHGQLVVRVADLEATERRGLTIRGQIMAEGSLRGQLAEVASRHEASGRVIKDLETRLTEIGFNPSKAEEARQQSVQANRELETARDSAVRTQQLLELKQQEVEQLGAQVAELDRLAGDLAEVRSNHFYGEKLSRLFGEFRKELIAGIRPRLADAGSRLMADMSGGRYQLMELDEEYNIRLFDNGQFYGIDRYSGGETDLANLCLRLAISMTLTESAGMERSMLILDEVFGSQDEGRRELIYQGLAGLKNRFPQIIAITHIEELKHRVETVIELVPTGSGWSEVQIDGHTS